MGVESNNQDTIKQPLLESQQPLYATNGLVTPQPIMIQPGISQQPLLVPMAKYKVRPDLNCAGNFRQYKTSFPVELLGTFSNQEYQSIIEDINRIVNFNKTPIVLAIIFQLLFVVPIIIFASIGNLPLLYVSIGCNIAAAFIVIGVSISLPRRMVKKLECHIACLNNNYANRNIRFEIQPKYISRSGKKFHVKLTIRYPPVLLAPVPAPQMYYNAPQQTYSSVPIYASQQQQVYQQPPSYLNNVDNNNNN